MKKLMMVGLATVAFGVAAACAGGLSCAVDEVLQGKTTAIEWSGSKFQIRPVEMIDKDKKTHVLNGTILCVNGKKEENVSYRVTKNGGAVKGIELQINNGMWLPLSPEMTTALGDYRKTGNVDTDKQAEIHKALYKAGEGSWMKTAELIVAFIAIKHC